MFARPFYALAALAMTTVPAIAQSGQALSSRQRLIVLTDIGNEPDDSESMVRLLLYSNEIDIEGLVATTSRHHPRSPIRQLIDERVAGYRKVLANLRVHDGRYPDADALQQRVLVGSAVYGMSGVGQGKDTAASRRIIKAVDSPDPRPVWISVWGGAADLAQALWTVRATRSAAALERFVAKLRVYSISDQDDAGPWARAYFPKLFWIADVHGFTRYSRATWGGISGPFPGADQSVVSKEWLQTNIRGIGPLGALYPLPAYIMEGDTPSFLNLIPNGLSVPERPDWGGWGGRYDRLSTDLGLWTTTSDMVRGADGEIIDSSQMTIWRWRGAYQNDFAARMQWSVTPRYKDANHAPEVTLNGRDGRAPVEIAACPGKPVALSAAGSKDADGDRLTYRWMSYREAGGLFIPSIKLSSDTGERTEVTIGDTARTDQFTPPAVYPIHVVLAVTDSGRPALTRYRRAIITVPGAASPTSTAACAVRPIPPVH
ncbi:MAG: nucleoside hydrolase-like domain-containing protein [Rhizorhabdus sp.]